MTKRYENTLGGPFSISHKSFIEWAENSMDEFVQACVPTEERADFWRAMFYDAVGRLKMPDEYLPDGMESPVKYEIQHLEP